MDRLTTGRRHVRAGSVSVTELITKQAARSGSPPPLDAGAKVPAEVAVAQLPTSHRRPTSGGVQLAKMTTLGVATMVLCGAVGVASTIAQQRADDSESPARPAEQISAEQALLPDELNRRLARDGETAVTPPSPAPATQVPRTTAPAPRASSPAVTTAPPAPPPAVPAPASDLDLVRAFYDVLPSDPAVAFDLLSPELLHSTLGRFLDSWSQVRSVDVVALEQQADGVLAVIGIRLADGGHLQLRQLVTVAESPRRIVDVELLSARRH